MMRKAAPSLLRRLAFWALTALAPSGGALAQDTAVLIADVVEITGQSNLSARGNVEVLQSGMRLMAAQLEYDRSTNTMQISGPIRLDDGVATTILASEAELSDDLRDGLILGAQVLIDKQLQLTAGAIQRTEGRFNTLHSVAASSCQICRGGAPLWEIRAKRVVHDVAEKQLYFDNAQFRIGGIPLAYFPRLRLADPTLKRATGFLVPKLEVTSTLGFGLRVPYFINISAHKDLLLTPYFTTTGTRSLDLRFRQAFRTGTLTISGSLSQDQVLAGQLRGYVLATASFTLPNRYALSLRGETVSDAGYFRSYGLNEQDRFVTSVQIDRADRNTFVTGRALGFFSVRSGDNNATQPSQIADFDRRQRFDLGPMGEAELAVFAALRQRASTDPFDGNDADTAADGRDVGGYGARLEWKKDTVLPLGILADAAVSLRADTYSVQEDAVFAGRYNRNRAAFAARLRWPLIKTGLNGAVHVIEPSAQMVIAPDDAQRLFNEDSALVEFDEGNLFAINRFAGSDRIEAGNRANLGITYSYYGQNGTYGRLALGRVISTYSTTQFAKASGLGQAKSDWLVAGQLSVNDLFGFTMRSLITENGDIRKMDFRGSANPKGSGISVGYLFAPADIDEQRSDTISEVSLYATQSITSRWKGSLTARYDSIAGKVSKAGAGLVYRNECIEVDVSLSRNFPTSSSVSANTAFGLSVALLGFGGQAAGKAAQCRG